MTPSWATANSRRLFVVDAGKNATYTIKWSGPKGTVFTEAPNNSGVVGFVGTIDMKTGFITPISTGSTEPTGCLRPGKLSTRPTAACLTIRNEDTRSVKSAGGFLRPTR